jgi:hypothetical protein
MACFVTVIYELITGPRIHFDCHTSHDMRFVGQGTLPLFQWTNRFQIQAVRSRQLPHDFLDDAEQVPVSPAKVFHAPGMCIFFCTMRPSAQ